MPDDTQAIDILKETCRNLNAGRTMFSRFRLERELGRGGMAVVWLARDSEFDSEVALKFLPGLVTDPVAERGLREEVKNTHTLVHENIVRVRDLRKDENSIAIDMEYVDGPKVSQLIAETPNCWLEPETAAPLVRGLCRAIDYAFNEPPNKPRRLVHRDIKPLNLMVNSAGVVKVVDFGIAHSVSETIARLTNASNPQHVVGTLPYMSPQQLKGEIHHLHDVYAIGATIFELLTGTPPFRARDVATLTSQINHEVPPSMTERRKQLVAEKNRKVVGSITVPKIWEETVAACLAKDPAQRPQGAKEIAIKLGLIADRPTHTPFSTTRKVGATGGRRWGLLAAITAALAVTGGVAWYFRNNLPPAGKESIRPTVAVTATPSPATAPSVPPEAAGPEKSEAALAPSTAPATTPAAAPAAAPAPPPPRGLWHLISRAPTQVTVTDAAGAIRFQALLSPGEKQLMPVDQKLLIEARDAGVIAFEIDGEPVTPPVAASGRWETTVPSDRNSPLDTKEAPLPFEAEVGPLRQSGQINQLEADWLRQALGGDKGDQERTLVARLFEKPPTLTVLQWRSQTALKFKPTREALTSADRAVMARAIDLVLAPGTVTMRLVRIEPETHKDAALADERARPAKDSPAVTGRIQKSFFIGVHEVTNGQLNSVTEDKPPSYYYRNADGKSFNPDFPVEQIKRSAIQEFIKKLNGALATTYKGTLTADLPTDDEWEYACRAGTTTAFNNGHDLEASKPNPWLNLIAHCNNQKSPQAVGKLQPNLWGLYDMHGNVQEWTRDNTLRGGSWKSLTTSCQSTSRKTGNPQSSRDNDIGFRLVLRLGDSAVGK